jgi:5'-nucleotidase (lipoprotein e(P4) family)
MKTRAAVWVTFVLMTGCASARPHTAPASPVSAASAVLPDAVRWVSDSAEYRALALQAYRAAGAHVDQQAAARQRGGWAVVLDADETVISNLQYEIERRGQGMAFTTEHWDAWVKRRAAAPIPGAAAFLSRVRALGGRIAIVTNRLDSQCADTAAVFKTHALVYDVMLCRPSAGPSDKNPRFAAVASGQAFGSTTPVDIVAFLGDNILDFPALSQAMLASGDAAFSDFGVRFFIIPNPLYGSWQ